MATAAVAQTIPVAANVASNLSPPFWQSTIAAAVLTGLVAIVVLVVNAIINTRMHSEKLAADRKLARERFEFEKDLAERKVRLEQALEDWRRKTAFAEQELPSFYEAASRLAVIRSPGAFGYEAHDRAGRDDETEDIRRFRDTYYPTLRRIQESGEFFNAFYARRYRAVALFGLAADNPYREIWQALNAVSVAAGMLMRERPEIANQRAADIRNSMEGRIWEGAADPDIIGAQITQAVAAAEALFLPAMQPPRHG